jgi:hypothetical protein
MVLPMATVTYLQLRLHDTDLAALDKYRREHLNPPTRPQAALDLVRSTLSGRAAATTGTEGAGGGPDGLAPWQRQAEE